MDDCRVRPVAIPKEIARGPIPGECLSDLPGDPFRGQVCGGVGTHQTGQGQAGVRSFGTVLGWFTEGFDIPDLIEAKGLLKEFA
jgi:hypothetical protein